MLTEPHEKFLAELQLGHANDALSYEIFLIFTQPLNLLTHHFTLHRILT